MTLALRPGRWSSLQLFEMHADVVGFATFILFWTQPITKAWLSSAPHLPTMAESELSPKFAPFIGMVSPSPPKIRGVRTDNGFSQAGIASAMIFGSTSTLSPVAREPTLDELLDDHPRLFSITNGS